MTQVPDPPELARLAAVHRETLKQDRATTVEQLGRGADAVVRKTYHNRGHRWLQSFGRRSRARREFDNLRLVAAAGVPCTEALGWSERRRFGCVDDSTLVTRLLPHSRPLKQVLAELPRDRTFAVRRRLCAAVARLVATLHRAGVSWCTAMPRNVLVQGDPAAAQLAVCDVPAAFAIGRSLHGTRLGQIDLFDAVFSPSRRRDWSATERLRWLVAYHDGDRGAARQTWRRLDRRGVLRHDVTAALTMFWYLYVVLPLRLRREPAPRSPR